MPSNVPSRVQSIAHTNTVHLVTVTWLFWSQSPMHQCQPQILNHFPLKKLHSSLFWEVCLQTSPVHLKSRPVPQLHKSHENALSDGLTLPSIDHCEVLQTCRLLRWTRGITTPSQDVRIVPQSKYLKLKFVILGFFFRMIRSDLTKSAVNNCILPSLDGFTSG